jgi:hypoxanthine phosphoribosyltransferase
MIKPYDYAHCKGVWYISWDGFASRQPIWKVPIALEVKGKCVAIIDEITDTGETLARASKCATKLGALQVVTGASVSHSWVNLPPQVTSLVSDELVIFTWDREVLEHGKWVIHPEIAEAIKAHSGGRFN